ncbi:MAG: hypothetical protein PWR07_1951 [Bacillota bacterium]|nr:hypothetical protein [Bacillota bacterium]
MGKGPSVICPTSLICRFNPLDSPAGLGTFPVAQRTQGSRDKGRLPGFIGPVPPPLSIRASISRQARSVFNFSCMLPRVPLHVNMERDYALGLRYRLPVFYQSWTGPHPACSSYQGSYGICDVAELGVLSGMRLKVSQEDRESTARVLERYGIDPSP